MLDLEELRKVGTCVFLAAEKDVAEDIARHIMDAADEVDRLRAALEKIAKEQSAPTAEGAADLFQRIAREALNGT